MTPFRSKEILPSCDHVDERRRLFVSLRPGVDVRTFDAGHWASDETAPVVNAARLEMLGAIPPSV